MDPITGAVVIAGLTTVGKPTAAALTSIIGRMLNPSADAIGQGISAPFHEWAKRRMERAGAVLIEAAEILEQKNVEPIQVPGRILMPILEHSSIEEDSSLRTTWARLLANAAVPEGRLPMLPAYATILAELSPIEVRLLDYIAVEGDEGSDVYLFDAEASARALQVPDDMMVVFRDNFVRLNLIQRPLGMIPIRSSEQIDVGDYAGPHYLTFLGLAFISACSVDRLPYFKTMEQIIADIDQPPSI